MVRAPEEHANTEPKSRSAPPPEVERLAYDIQDHCRATHTGRSTTYKALNPDPAKRDGLPYLPSFHVGRRRLILVEDSLKWLAKLKAASMAKAEPRRSDAA